jgi:DeoR/GlpR family transcriptional regulator of sugar metabolism
MNFAEPISSEDRQNEIFSLLKSEGRVAVSQLSTQFNVSEATIRRDLRQMAELNLLRRVHGGAIPAQPVEPEPPFLQRTKLYTREKQRIGAAAAGLINPGETVILIGGSTTLELAPYLAHKDNLTIITNSLLIAQGVARNSSATVIMLGGIVLNSELTTGGHLVQLCLDELRANKVIFGVRAVNPNEGLLLDAAAEVMIFRQCIKAANEAILVVDHSKFGQLATAALGPLSLVNRIVTDQALSPEMSARLDELNIEVIVA